MIAIQSHIKIVFNKFFKLISTFDYFWQSNVQTKLRNLEFYKLLFVVNQMYW